MTPIDLIAAVAVVGGSLLVALGGIGLLRFPDVFTRMHGATKAATIGVVGTTLAAALEAGSPRGVLILLLVVALLFLSGPLGMSLLARAAYHDHETPRSPLTAELPFELPIPEVTGSSRRGGPSYALGVWLFIVWIALFGSVAPNVVIGGIVVAAIVTFAFRRLSPHWPVALAHPVRTAEFLVFFGWQVVRSTWDVVWSLRLDRHLLRPAIIEYPISMTTRSEVTLLMNSISFTPGTVALELHDQLLYVHVLNAHDPAPVIAEINALETRIMAMYGQARQIETG
jgi:multicomponent Na+:H+ antiporter subunit G